MSRSALVPCESCSRHVKASPPGGDRCPFCDAPVTPRDGARAPRSPVTSRAALVAAGAGTILATAACSASTPTDRDAATPDVIVADAPVPDGSLDAPSVVPAYGAVILPDASIDSTRDAP